MATNSKNENNTTISKLIKSLKEIETSGVNLTMSGIIFILENSLEDERKELQEMYNQGWDEGMKDERNKYI